MKLTKKLIPTNDVCIKFTEDELIALNIKEGDKFSISVEDESIVLDKHVPLEIDLADFDRTTLEFLIAESIEQDISVNEVISSVLTKCIDNPDFLEKLNTTKQREIKNSSKKN